MYISFYPEKEASFSSKYSIFEAVDRLSSKLDLRVFRTFSKGGIVGTVKPEEVLLRYHRPWFCHYIVFRGTFSVRNDSVVLSGKFESSKPVQIFMTSFLLCTIFLFCFPFIFIENNSAKYDFLVIPICIALIWIANFCFYRRLWRRDFDYLNKTINSALL